jgi:CBS domain-containing protein
MARASGMAVRDWMSRRVATVRPDARLGEAARLMGARKIRHLPVVEAAGRLVGIVTARDLRQAVFPPCRITWSRWPACWTASWSATS